jgi:hypothetical protein
MTSEEFVARVLAAEEELDSDWLAWKVEEIAAEYREELA